MKKADQLEMNEALEDIWAIALCDVNCSYKPHTEEKLRTCKASVKSTCDYKVLYSYGTAVAAIRWDGTGIDMLRYAYGYTATSAQHIRKFFDDYEATDIQTWRKVS